jgi:hypothetical protein
MDRMKKIGERLKIAAAQAAITPESPTISF